jgi:hypothetical protein
MEREPAVKRRTQISYKTEEKTVLRGYNLSDLAEEGYTFCDALFVLFQGRIPTEAEEEMLEYEMAEFLEHSMSPSAAAAICTMGGRPQLPAAVAAGNTAFAELGFSPNAAWAIGCITRGFSCACHAIENMTRGRAWMASRGEKMAQLLDLSMIAYDGIPDRPVP